MFNRSYFNRCPFNRTAFILKEAVENLEFVLQSYNALTGYAHIQEETALQIQEIGNIFASLEALEHYSVYLETASDVYNYANVLHEIAINLTETLARLFEIINICISSQFDLDIREKAGVNFGINLYDSLDVAIDYLRVGLQSDIKALQNLEFDIFTEILSVIKQFYVTDSLHINLGYEKDIAGFLETIEQFYIDLLTLVKKNTVSLKLLLQAVVDNRAEFPVDIDLSRELMQIIDIVKENQISIESAKDLKAVLAGRIK